MTDPCPSTSCSATFGRRRPRRSRSRRRSRCRGEGRWLSDVAGRETHEPPPSAGARRARGRWRRCSCCISGCGRSGSRTAPSGSDYTAFYTGWTIVAEGDGANLYDPAFQAGVQKEILGGRTFEAGLNPFNNPPHLVVPVRAAHGACRCNASYVVWAAVQLALLGWLLWRLLTRVAGDWSRDERTLLVAASIAAPPLALALLQGSFSLLVTVALLEVYLALRAGGDRAAAAWLVVASVKPQAVLTTGVALLAGRQWRVARLRRDRDARAGPGGDGGHGRRHLVVVPGLHRRLRRLVRRVQRPPVGHVEPARDAQPVERARGRRGDRLAHQHDRPRRAGRGARRGRLAVARPLGPVDAGLRVALLDDAGARAVVQPAPQSARRPAAGARRRDRLWGRPRAGRGAVAGPRLAGRPVRVLVPQLDRRQPGRRTAHPGPGRADAGLRGRPRGAAPRRATRFATAPWWQRRDRSFAGRCHDPCSARPCRSPCRSACRRSCCSAWSRSSGGWCSPSLAARPRCGRRSCSSSRRSCWPATCTATCR